MFKTVNLEISLKPFKRTDDEYIRGVCQKVFEQWRPLLKGRETISIMLWVADGSEILDYAGDLEDKIEWCYFMGTANHPLLSENERKDTSIHDRTQLYMENPPVITYRILKKIISTFKEEGKKAFPDAIIRVGETFDIGPEFSKSDFKNNRHTEITSGEKLDSFGFVDATALLDGDNRPYAAYPTGIPDKTPFATFLGKQSGIFLRDMGFDYLWLSNGLGFSANPWQLAGKIFDGENFHSEKLGDTAKQVFDFWRLFREACPDFPLEVRGTNNSVGIDYATDGVPLYDIYNGGFNITPPPNSPWAAINDDYGLEIMGHMTRICNLPCEDFMFRFYLHDPWWINSPWYDRYCSAAHDIYLPMAISRIDGNGCVKTANTLNILSIDNTFGDMPELCVYEPLPHFLNAEKNVADKPSPLVWVYPMKEYTTTSSEEVLREMYYGDSYIRDAINDGLPLNCVVSTDNFLETPLSLYKESILISPIPESRQVAERLNEFEAQGGKVIYYGNAKRATEASISDCIDVTSSPDAIREKLVQYGYYIDYKRKTDTKKKTVMTISPSDNALWFSVHNSYTSTETTLHFPLGAPILNNLDAELIDGNAIYRFSRCEHRECRIYVEQKSGIVSSKECAPVNAMFHRKLMLEGLQDATVCIFPEDIPSKSLSVGFVREDNYFDGTPDFDKSFQRVEDEKYGVYYRAEHVSGRRMVYLPNKK